MHFLTRQFLHDKGTSERRLAGKGLLRDPSAGMESYRGGCILVTLVELALVAHVSAVLDEADGVCGPNGWSAGRGRFKSSVGRPGDLFFAPGP